MRYLDSCLTVSFDESYRISDRISDFAKKEKIKSHYDGLRVNSPPAQVKSLIKIILLIRLHTAKMQLKQLSCDLYEKL